MLADEMNLSDSFQQSTCRGPVGRHECPQTSEKTLLAHLQEQLVTAQGEQPMVAETADEPHPSWWGLVLVGCVSGVGRGGLVEGLVSVQMAGINVQQCP
jgi:hypothetical protein